MCPDPYLLLLSAPLGPRGHHVSELRRQGWLVEHRHGHLPVSGWKTTLPGYCSEPRTHKSAFLGLPFNFCLDVCRLTVPKIWECSTRRTRIYNPCKIEKIFLCVCVCCLGVPKVFTIPSVFTQNPEWDVPTTPWPFARAAAEESEGQDGLWWVLMFWQHRGSFPIFLIYFQFFTLQTHFSATHFWIHHPPSKNVRKHIPNCRTSAMSYISTSVQTDYWFIPLSLSGPRPKHL